MMPECLRNAIVMCAAVLSLGTAVSSQVIEGNKPPGSEVINVFNPIEGRITVLSARPEGARAVEKG